MDIYSRIERQPLFLNFRRVAFHRVLANEKRVFHHVTVLLRSMCARGRSRVCRAFRSSLCPPAM